MSNERSPRWVCSTTMGTSGIRSPFGYATERVRIQASKCATLWLRMFESQNKRTAVRRSIDLGAPGAEVWKAITDDALLSDWLPDQVGIDPRPGGALSCRAEDGERTGLVELAEEGQRLVFTWRGGEVAS